MLLMTRTSIEQRSRACGPAPMTQDLIKHVRAEPAGAADNGLVSTNYVILLLPLMSDMDDCSLATTFLHSPHYLAKIRRKLMEIWMGGFLGKINL